jgi:hypothetical protein
MSDKPLPSSLRDLLRPAAYDCDLAGRDWQMVQLGYALAGTCLHAKTIRTLMLLGFPDPEPLLRLTEAELQALPGIGKASLTKIVTWRDVVLGLTVKACWRTRDGAVVDAERLFFDEPELGEQLVDKIGWRRVEQRVQRVIDRCGTVTWKRP